MRQIPRNQSEGVDSSGRNITQRIEIHPDKRDDARMQWSTENKHKIRKNMTQKPAYSARLSFSDSSSNTLAFTKLGAGAGGRSPRTGPFWFTPGGLGAASGLGFGVFETAVDAVDCEDALTASPACMSRFDDTGATPQRRPRTQPPTRRPKVAALRGLGVAVLSLVL